MDCFIHQSPGRLRVRAASLKSNVALADQLALALERLHGVDFVTVRRVTGSIVVHYDAQMLLPSRLLGVLARHDVLPANVVGFPRPVPPRRPLREKLPTVAAPSVQISPETQKILWAAGKVLLVLLLERAVDKKTRTLLSAFL